MLQVCDSTAPVITPTPPLPCVEATSVAGAVVTYTVPTATDVVSGTVTVTCVKASGSTFPIGSTSVVCTAKDAAGNTATSTIPIKVIDLLLVPCFLRLSVLRLHSLTCATVITW
jgi:hypothetical protein